ncbi:hypothetical protein TNCV_2708431 [Trichonephila clavipes]|nr:hypothetical protein TNCV_2708431 [Trichonephila clavipes]
MRTILRYGSSNLCHRIVDANLRESGTAYRPETDPGKGPTSDMQYHGVGRDHEQWPHAPTCGCDWDYDGANDTLMKFLLVPSLFVFSVVFPA